MPKRIEQLELNDLRAAFNKYLDSIGEPEYPDRRYTEWRRFYSYLKDKCSVVDGI